MNQTSMQAKLSIYRYAVLAVTITAFIVSLFTPVIFTANPNFVTSGFSLTVGDVFVPSLFVAFAALLIGMMSYMVYAQFLKQNAEKRKFVLG